MILKWLRGEVFSDPETKIADLPGSPVGEIETTRYALEEILPQILSRVGPRYYQGLIQDIRYMRRKNLEVKLESIKLSEHAGEMNKSRIHRKKYRF